MVAALRGRFGVGIVRAFVGLVDRVSYWFGFLAAGGLFAIGLIVAWEVVMRNLGRPTNWTADISQGAQVWCVFLGAAYVLRQREMICVDILRFDENSPVGRLVWIFGLLVVGGLSLVIMQQGLKDVARSISLGTNTDTVIAMPLWVLQIPLPIGLGLVAVQCVAEILRSICGLGGEPARKLP